jgi:small redox-active disulfide protein 2
MMEIQVLGTGCRDCGMMEENTRKAVAELKLDAEVVIVTDLMKMMMFATMETPGLAVNGKVLAAGRLLEVDEIKALIEEELQKQNVSP